MPAPFAASQIVVPSGTVTSCPSMVRLTVLISVGAGVEMATICLWFSSGLDRVRSLGPTPEYYGLIASPTPRRRSSI